MKAINNLLQVSICCCFLSSCLAQEHILVSKHSLEELRPEKIELAWSKENVYTVWSVFDTTISASDNKVCFLGGLDNLTDNEVVCIDSTNGDLLWQEESGNHSAIEVTSDAVFVAYNNIVGIRKYSSSGGIVWSEQLSGTGSIYIYVVGGELQILTIPEKFWVLDFDGNKIKNIVGDKVFINTADEVFVKLGGIELQKPDSRQVVWQFNDFDDVLEMAPVFVGTKIILRTGQESGSIIALDRETGKLLWKTKNNIISNVVYSPSKETLYALTHDGELLMIDTNSGQAENIAQFSSVPFILNGEANVGNYQLAYDSSVNILFLSLGDSRQLFAFSEK